LARSQDQLNQLTGELTSRGSPRALAVTADLDNHEQLAPLVRDLIHTHGPVHILINNTGGPPSGPLLNATPDQIRAALHRHLLGAHLLTQLVLPGMAEARYGRIIGVLSTSVRAPLDNLGVSNLTRAAVASWAKTLSRELPAGVTINNVLPGYTATKRLSTLIDAVGARTGRTSEAVEASWRDNVPEGRFAQPGEIGSVIAFLASPAASYIRGVCLPVDGGRLRSI